MDIQREFFDSANKYFKYQNGFIDLMPYAVGKTIRMPECPKVCDKGVIPNRVLKLGANDTIKQYLITFIDNYQVFDHQIYRGQLVSHVYLNAVDGLHNSNLNAIQ